ncbi:hypothetical protein N9C00_02285 [Flavobacteriales bacterium]|nr:hypothetical protein [Flavobacteriales bacterium]
MDTELIQDLHNLSSRANRIILSKTKVSHIAFIDETFDLEQFLDVTCYALQSDLINANEKTINLIINNLATAIESNCGNNVDLTKYSKADVFPYSFERDLNERSVSRRYKITDISPKDISVFKEIWLFDFLENLKTILKNIKVITQQADIIKLDEVKNKSSHFIEIKLDEVNKTLSHFIENVEEKQNFIEELKGMFPTEKGKSIKAVIAILQENDIIIIPDRQFREFYTCLKNDFKRDIGSYTSINDSKDFDEAYLDPFKNKLHTLIKSYKKI